LGCSDQDPTLKGVDEYKEVEKAIAVYTSELDQSAP